MRNGIMGICVGIASAWSTLACGSDSDGPNSGSTSRGGTNSGMTGGASAGGSANGSGGGVAQAGTGGSSAGGAMGGSAGTGNVGGAGAGGVGGATTAAAVYVMSNAAANNEIYGFLRATDGTLTAMPAAFPTGGKGTGAGLGEQGALAYDLENNRVYTVNAGDHSFSVFPVNADGSLGAAVKVTTEGFGSDAASLLGPKSVTFYENTVYVLFQGNETTASKIAGWSLSGSGASIAATPIVGSVLPLSSTTRSVDPAQIEFSPDGKWLVVTEKQSGNGGSVEGAGSIDTFSVGAGGVATLKGFFPTAPAVDDTGGLQMTPFGFAFYGQYLIISEAGSTGTGSYSYSDGVVVPVAATAQFLPTDPAPCWVTMAGNRAYVTNARGPNISGFTVGANGGLANIGPIENAIVASTGKSFPDPEDPESTIFQGPTDEFVSADGRFLYVLNSAVPSIGIFEIQENGTLARVGTDDYAPATASALPKGSVGIVAR